MKKKMSARVVPSKIYSRIIEINTPLRFYWNEDGTFDGIEYTLPKSCSSYQRKLISETVNIMWAMHEMYQELTEAMKDATPLPAFLKKEFPNEFDDKEPV